MGRELPLYCARCGSRIRFEPGLCGNRIVEAVLLQSVRLGVEVECESCQSAFIYSRLESSERLRQSEQRRELRLPRQA